MLVATIALLAACTVGGSSAPSSQQGSDGGPPASQPVDGLSAAEQAALCASLFAADAGPLECPYDGGTLTFTGLWGTQALCMRGLSYLASMNCQATVGQVTACLQSSNSCAAVGVPGGPPDCAPVFGCADAGSTGSGGFPHIGDGSAE